MQKQLVGSWKGGRGKCEISSFLLEENFSNTLKRCFLQEKFGFPDRRTNTEVRSSIAATYWLWQIHEAGQLPRRPAGYLQEQLQLDSTCRLLPSHGPPLPPMAQAFHRADGRGAGRGYTLLGMDSQSWIAESLVRIGICLINHYKTKPQQTHAFCAGTQSTA